MFVRLVDEDGIEQFINTDNILHIAVIPLFTSPHPRSKIYFVDGSFIIVPMAPIDIFDKCGIMVKV